MVKTLKNINWNQVYCFYEVSRKLSMKEAGELLGVSTPTVSEQIKRLEHSIGVKLFRRVGKKLELTHEGSTLFGCAREMFEAGGRFLDTVSPDAIGGYSVRVAMQDSLAASMGIDFLNQYWDMFAPFGTVHLVRVSRLDAIIEKMILGQLDWAISLEKPISSRLESKPIASMDFVFCCSESIFCKFIHKEDILRCIPLAKSHWDTVLNQVVEDTLRESNIFPEESVESDYLQFVIELAKRGRCVAVLPKQAVLNSEWGRYLKTFSLPKPIRLDLLAIWPKGNERMVSIKKLCGLLNMKKVPTTMEDPHLQIRVGEVKETMLRNHLSFSEAGS